MVRRDDGTTTVRPSPRAPHPLSPASPAATGASSTAPVATRAPTSLALLAPPEATVGALAADGSEGGPAAVLEWQERPCALLRQARVFQRAGGSPPAPAPSPWLAGGAPELLESVRLGDGFDQYRLSPAQLRREFAGRGADAVFVLEPDGELTAWHARAVAAVRR